MLRLKGTTQLLGEVLEFMLLVWDILYHKSFFFFLKKPSEKAGKGRREEGREVK